MLKKKVASLLGGTDIPAESGRQLTPKRITRASSNLARELEEENARLLRLLEET